MPPFSSQRQLIRMPALGVEKQIKKNKRTKAVPMFCMPGLPQQCTLPLPQECGALWSPQGSWLPASTTASHLCSLLLPSTLLPQVPVPVRLHLSLKWSSRQSAGSAPWLPALTNSLILCPPHSHQPHMSLICNFPLFVAFAGSLLCFY